MALLKVFWTQTAILQRNLVFRYWNNRNKSNEYSIKLNIEIKERILLLKSYPFIGKKTEFQDIRILPIKHYSILYKIENSRILIMAFWDNRQNPRKLLKLLRENK
ncbi:MULTISPECIES: type II toxin-antitoxin system RelE/ParE family toxin [Proteiniphilum]|uniref:type II toxin-antitoxin system RelE/ParE family toxin n=1 Tax=Proteiniphilum TaxID=294702 RepID=UPI000B80C889|nr:MULTISPECIES: type II toxin-antitoxin system RelE/ParE family toxin [Proteiniphilum]MDY9917366.1 type II toxin-antitoxin system RelE/ParE family toxin [Proteiniphilum sp.]